VLRVARKVGQVEVATTRWGVERFDQVVFASHSDQALDLLADASRSECEILGAIGYQPNEVVLHTDVSVMPRNRKAWAAWNALIPAEGGQTCTVSYCMNLLQGISSPEPLIVSLNCGPDIDPRKILRQMRYAHPLYSPKSVAARARKAEIQGQRRTWFTGAYWGWGFHEDGIRSAVEVAAALGVPWQTSSTQQRSNVGQHARELAA
jgi:predicted NAD/FAD-binding protein